jgi:hypothetical protein
MWLPYIQLQNKEQTMPLFKVHFSTFGFKIQVIQDLVQIKFFRKYIFQIIKIIFLFS